MLGRYTEADAGIETPRTWRIPNIAFRINTAKDTPNNN